MGNGANFVSILIDRIVVDVLKFEKKNDNIYCYVTSVVYFMFSFNPYVLFKIPEA